MTATGGERLPYGDGCMNPIDMHYQGCGCPPDPRTRLYPEVLDRLWFHQLFQQEDQPPKAARRLIVAYVLPHHSVTGGMKMLCEHLRLLCERGHFVIAVHWSDTETRAVPPWFDVKVDLELVLRLNQRLRDVLYQYVMKLDVVVVGWFTQITSVLSEVGCPVMYFEQGHEYLFADPIRFSKHHDYSRSDRKFHSAMHLPVALAAVSNAPQTILERHFGRLAMQVPNGIDCSKFMPGTRSARLFLQKECKSILLVGNPNLPLKGFDIALTALQALAQHVRFETVWILQKEPVEPLLSAARHLGVRLIQNPPQEDIPEYYRGHDAFLFCSRYEGFGMPVLEAMASGVPTVCTLTVSSFAKHRVNCLVSEPKDVASIVQNLIYLLTDSEGMATKLVQAGLSTAKLFSWQMVGDRLEKALTSLADTQPLLDQTGMFTPQMMQNFVVANARAG